MLRLGKCIVRFRRIKVFRTQKKRPIVQERTITKKVSPAVAQILLKLKSDGASATRHRKNGARPAKEYQDVWSWSDGPLFPATRPDSRSPMRVKDTACKAIIRIRRSFIAADSTGRAVPTYSIRTHSGRHHKINQMKRNSVPQEAAGKYAAIENEQVYARYGKLTAHQAGSIVAANRGVELAVQSSYDTVMREA